MTENARGRESAQILVFSGSLLKREKEGKPNVRICKKSGNFEQSENTAKAGYTKCLPWERRQVFFSKAFKATTKTLKLQQNSNKTTRTSLQQLKHSRKSSGNFFFKIIEFLCLFLCVFDVIARGETGHGKGSVWLWVMESGE